MSKNIIPKNWRKFQLKKVATIQTGIAKGKKDINNPIELPYLRVANVQDGYLDLNEIKTIAVPQDQVKRYLLQKNDIVLTEGGDFDKLGRGTIWKDQIIPCLHQNHIFVVRTQLSILIPEFFGYQAASLYGKKYFLSCAKKTTSLASINSTQLSEFPVLLPPINEQKKIVEILTTWDEAIALTEKAINSKAKLKIFLTNHLLFGKIRFLSTKKYNFTKHSCFSFPSDWKLIKLGKIFTERRETSSNLDQYDLVSLTIEDGLINKPERYIRDFLLKDKESNQYRLVYPGDFVYNPMNLRFGAINLSRFSKPVLVSAYYNVLIPDNEIIPSDLLLDLLTTPQIIHVYNNVGIGSLIEKKRVHLSDFIKLEIPIPPEDESKKINTILKTLDQEISAQIKYKNLLEQQKRGLMQKLLTGEWLVPVTETND